MSSWLYTNDTTTYSYFLSFGKTFASPPQAIVGCTSAYLNSGATLFFNYGAVQSVNNSGVGVGLITMAEPTVSTTGVNFRIVHVANTGSLPGSAAVEYRMDFHYVIFQV